MTKRFILLILAVSAIFVSSCSDSDHISAWESEFEIGTLSYSATDITENSAVIKGQIKWKNDNYDPKDCEVYIFYQASEKPIEYFTDAETIIYGVRPDLKIEFNLKKLKPFTTYYYCVHVSSPGVGGSSGKVKSFKTK